MTSNSPITMPDGIFAMPLDVDHAAKLQSSRRTFLKLSGAGLVLGLAAPLPGLTGNAAQAAAPLALAPNPFLIVAPDNTVTVIIKHLDKGQGAATGLLSLIHI